jgi:hypothetical protein
MKTTSPRRPFTDWIHPLALFAIKYWQNLKEQFRLRERHVGRSVHTSCVRTALPTSCRKVRAHVLRSNGSINVTSEGPCTRPAFERLYKRHVGRSVHTSCVRTALSTSRRKVRAEVLRSNGSINVTSECPCIRPTFERLYQRHVGRSVYTSCVRTALWTRTPPKCTRKWEDFIRLGVEWTQQVQNCDQWSLVHGMMTLGLTRR